MGRYCTCYIRFGDIDGADIKVPWELARLHHLVYLAYAHRLANRNEPDFRVPDVYKTEFQVKSDTRFRSVQPTKVWSQLGLHHGCRH